MFSFSLFSIDKLTCKDITSLSLLSVAMSEQKLKITFTSFLVFTLHETVENISTCIQEVPEG